MLWYIFQVIFFIFIAVRYYTYCNLFGPYRSVNYFRLTSHSRFTLLLLPLFWLLLLLPFTHVYTINVTGTTISTLALTDLNNLPRSPSWPARYGDCSGYRTVSRRRLRGRRRRRETPHNLSGFGLDNKTPASRSPPKVCRYRGNVTAYVVVRPRGPRGVVPTRHGPFYRGFPQ